MSLDISNNSPITLIAGPCVFENIEHGIRMAYEIKWIAKSLGIENFVYKTSFDKANRTSHESYRGEGLKECMKLFKILKEDGFYTTTDIHKNSQAEKVAKYTDIIQIPALLCRQTDLILAAADTGRIVNIKKGQFLSPSEIPALIKKAKSTGNNKIWLTERGTFFGYNRLVNDFSGVYSIRESSNIPIVFDATHSVQYPGGLGSSTSGNRAFVEPLSLCATTLGIAGLFLEVHDNPNSAPSDGPNMVNLKDLKPLLEKVLKIDRMVKNEWN